MSPRRTTNYDIVAGIEELLANETLMLLLADDWDEGFPTSASGDGTGSRPIGGHSDRTCNEATRGTDGERPREGHGLSDQLRKTHAQLQLAKHLIRQARDNWHRLQPDDHQLAELKHRAADVRNIGVGGCAVSGCDTYCTGGLNDRLKSAFCPACYRAWIRHRTTENEAGRTANRIRFGETWMPQHTRYDEVTGVTTVDPTDTGYAHPANETGVRSPSTRRDAPGPTGPEAA